MKKLTLERVVPMILARFLEKELIVSTYNGKAASHRISYNRSAGRLLTGSGQHMDMPSFPDYAPLGGRGFRTAGRLGW